MTYIPPLNGGRINATISGNTAGAGALLSTGTVTLAGGNNITLSQNGNAITISGAAGGGGGFSAGISNIGNTGGTSGMATNQLVFAGGNNVTLSQSTAAGGNTIYVSAADLGGGGGGRTMDFYQNMDRGTTASLATGNGTLMLQRLNQENNLFGASVTAGTLLMNMTANMTATSLSSSHTISAFVGVYSDNATRLNLINSASSSWALGAATNNTVSYHGPRWLSFVSSQWSSPPVFDEGGDYVFGVFFRSSNYGPPLSYQGQNYMFSNQRSGFVGTSMATNTTLAHGNYWNAIYSATTSAFPSVITSNQVNRNNASAIFIPHLIINNRYSGTF